MNVRFPEIFGMLLFGATLCSFGMPLAMSGRVANSMHWIFAPLAGPVQWAMGSQAQQQADAKPVGPAIVTDAGGELANLREENRRLRAYVETLVGQLYTVARQQTEAGVVGREASQGTQTVRVIGADAGGRDVLRIAGPTASTFEVGQAVMARGNIVGRIDSVGAVAGASVRLITDRGFRTQGTFQRFEGVGEQAALTRLTLEPRICEGNGRGEMRVLGLTMAEVQQAGLKIGDAVMLVDGGTQTQRWPIAVHGSRIGTITYIEEGRNPPGVAEVRVRPEIDLMTLRDVSVVRKEEE